MAESRAGARSVQNKPGLLVQKNKKSAQREKKGGGMSPGPRSQPERGQSPSCGSLSNTVNNGMDFPADPGVKNLPANAGDMGSMPGLG